MTAIKCLSARLPQVAGFETRPLEARNPSLILAAPIVGGMITSTIHALILVPVFFPLMKERALRRGVLRASDQ